MDRKDIDIYNAIVSQKNITRAANELFMSPSTVGAHLKVMEEELGVLLVERQKGAKVATLTKQGEDFAKIAKEMSLLWKDADEIIQTTPSSYELTVGATDSFFKHAMIPVYKKLMHAENSFQFQLRLATTDILYSLINQKEIDVAFLLYYLKFPDMRTEKLFEDDMVILASQHLYPDSSTIHPDQLNPNLEIMIKSGDDFTGWGQDFYSWHNRWFEVDQNPLITVNTLSLASNFFDQEKFWILIPRMIAEEYAKEFNLKVFHLEVEPPKWKCFMVTREFISASKKEALELLKDEIITTLVY
jgi:DNA-binding transcriptional LysR family regulator